jgi:hypothetical protein
MLSPLYPIEVEKCKTENRWVLALPFKNDVPHSPIYRGLWRARDLGVALLKLLWKMWDARNILRPTHDTNLSWLESSVACIDYMCGRWVSRDDLDMSRYVFTSGLSGLEHKKVLWITHTTSVASNGRLNCTSSCRINCETTLYHLFMKSFRRQLHLEKQIGCCKAAQGNPIDWMALALQHAGCRMTWQVLLDKVCYVSHDWKGLQMVWIHTWWFPQALET